MDIENLLESGHNQNHRNIFEYLMLFNIEVNDEIVIIPPTGVKVGRDIDTLVRDINNIFGIQDSRDLCMRWYTRAIRGEIKDLFTFLNKCTLKLGRSNWIVTTEDGNIINIKKLLEYFYPMYSENFIINYFNDWKMDKMVEETEKIMGKLY